ncbi:hypothetical protein ALQ37_02266 [Pseudomonas syringae pv. aptata]|uniref:Uncharacterized protein n=1 Tax=Pseudomonas syringae pv. aptata TaxID=83167 RepID=A0A3M3WKY8_PSEAP|nr:hypothetical protein ALQ37_02266 [Pseudomonas syringae pv. aptata]
MQMVTQVFDVQCSFRLLRRDISDQTLVASSVVSCEVVNNGVVLACGYSVIELSEVIDEGRWEEMSMFTVMVPGTSSGDHRTGSLYPNGYQQLRLQVKTQVMPVDGVDYQLSPTEMASMRLVDDITGQNIESVFPTLDGMPEGDDQAWRVRKQHNRFELSGAGVFAAESGLDVPRPVAQDFYLHSRAEPGFSGVFYATFQDDNGKWWTSVQYEEVNSKVEINPRRLPTFDTRNYTFVPKRLDNNGTDPSVDPPPEGSPDDPFDMHFNTTDYWKLNVTNPDTQQEVKFETLKFLPYRPDSDVINTSIILWESRQAAEVMFSWTGFIFDDPAVKGDVSKVRFDEVLKDVMGDVHTLDIDVDTSVFETGKLIISLHRLRGLTYIPEGDPARDKLMGTLAAPSALVVLLIDKQGNAHKRRISFLPSGSGRRNRLMHTLYSETRPQ